MPPPFTITPAVRRARDAGHERDRRGEDQRTRGRDHHHREEAHRVAGDGPGEPGDAERDGQEDRRVAVGEPNERGALGLGMARRDDDSGVRALGRGARRSQLEGVARVGGAAAHLAAFAAPHGQRLAGQRRLVEHCDSVRHDAVHRDHLAGADDDESPGTQIADRHLPIALPRRRCAMRGIRSSSRVSSRPARCVAYSSSALPPASISATTAPTRYWPSARRETIATSAIASTPRSRRISDRADRVRERDEDHRGRSAQTASLPPASREMQERAGNQRCERSEASSRRVTVTKPPSGGEQHRRTATCSSLQPKPRPGSPPSHQRED